MYLLFNKNLLQIMGEHARKSFADQGLHIQPKYQYKIGNQVITIAKIIDETKAAKYINHPDCTLLTLAEANAKIDEYHSYTYSVSNEALYNADISKKINDGTLDTSKISAKWSKQQELKYLHSQGVLGIKKSNPIDYFSE